MVDLMKAPHPMRAQRSFATLRRLATDTRGTALVEFAITLPFLLTLYLGCVQLCDAVSAYRKTTTTSRTIVDLTSQQTQVTDTKLQQYLDAAAQVMAPYATDKLGLVVTQVSVNALGVARVDWSRASGNGAVAPAAGDVVTLPAGVGVPNTSLIVGQATYTYNTDFGSLITKTIPMSETTYMYPRSISSIPKVS